MTRFAKRGLTHISNFLTLRMCNSICVSPTALKFGTRYKIIVYHQIIINYPLSCTYLYERKVHVNSLLTIDFMLQSSKLNNQMGVQDSFFQIQLQWWQWWLSGFSAVSSMCIECVDTEIIVVISFIIIISTSDVALPDRFSCLLFHFYIFYVGN